MKAVISATVALVLLAAGAWFTATRTESPAQVAARAEPPAPVPVVAELSVGHVDPPTTLAVEVQPAATAVVKAPPAVTGVVTAVAVTAGQRIGPGSVAMRVDGRPLFVLPGAFDLYRDIRPGDSGDDVAALQEALKGAGYYAGRVDGAYGAGTQAAVRRMYVTAGYDVPLLVEATDEDAVGTQAVAGEQVEKKRDTPSETSGDGTPADDRPDGADAATAQPGPLPAPRRGAGVLRSEILMVRTLPATVAGSAAVGTHVGETTDLLTLASGDLVLTATVPAESVGALAVGASGRLTDDTGAPGTAEIVAIDTTAADGQARIRSTTSAAVTSGQRYVLAVDDPAATGEAELLAPVAAVVHRGGLSHVYVRDGAQFREVQVEVLGTSGGVAAIRPLAADDTLGPGTEVRVG